MLDLLTLAVFPLLMAFAVLAAAAGLPIQNLLVEHLACSAAVLALTFGLFAFGWIGGGDAKLAAATALWLGWGHLAEYGLLASLLGAGLTFGILYFRKFALPVALGDQPWLLRLHAKDNGVPYGVALAAAGLLLYPQTELWRLVVAA